MFSFPRFLKNAIRLLKSPRMTSCYLNWLTAKWIFSRPVTITYFGGIRLGRFSSFSEYWLRHRGLDKEDIEIIKACFLTTQTPAVALDVGANLGLFSLAMAKAGFQEVHAFEPIPKTHDRLVANIRDNPLIADRLILNRSGVGAVPGHVEFAVFRDSPGQNKIASGCAAGARSFERVRCEVTTIDSYFKSKHINNCVLMKIDVEGFESDVLKGGSNVLSSGRIQFVYSEIISDAFRNAGSSVAEFHHLIVLAGFDPVVLDRGNFKTVTFEEALEVSGKRRNVLFRFRH